MVVRVAILVWWYVIGTLARVYWWPKLPVFFFSVHLAVLETLADKGHFIVHVSKWIFWSVIILLFLKSKFQVHQICKVVLAFLFFLFLLDLHIWRKFEQEQWATWDEKEHHWAENSKIIRVFHGDLRSIKSINSGRDTDIIKIHHIEANEAKNECSDSTCWD